MDGFPDEYAPRLLFYRLRLSRSVPPMEILDGALCSFRRSLRGLLVCSQGNRALEFKALSSDRLP